MNSYEFKIDSGTFHCINVNFDFEKIKLLSQR